MKKICFLLSILLFNISCNYKVDDSSETNKKTSDSLQQTPKAPFGIVIHGGAGYIKKGNLSDSLENAYREKLKEAITTGNEILKNGGSSIEAVKRSINVMEDSPLFNSGKGAVLTHEEKPELDASIMDGKTLNAGGIAGVSTVKNPINLAYEVMEHSDHVLLAREGAEAFAKTRNLEIVEPSYFITDKQLQNIKRIKNENANKEAAFYNSDINGEKFGTVGCVALDKNGNLAAGTSTGGTANKKWGRIGDSPIIGAGTYANNKTCAVSGTGWGEYYIRGVVAYDISALMEYKGLSLEKATKEVIQKKQPELGGNGGIIAIDHLGNISMEFNTPGMFRASFVNDSLTIGMYRE
ncbi:isoaspartyl peptidase/L-asparaginase family protein [Mesonia maritima]|uniref:Beta-aspartyl-peptidase (Threonine type) n=1 Tax=Mesonia maritima TaxID=1793873 RepID=A0ABU1K236_9FLAO|nr:isoaspartyl peptidase/L-asparaginase [Mesonia maritima]MDR6299670.1 beta-aspartyl-peptidase (threonine type) [Mesonia maritima]